MDRPVFLLKNSDVIPDGQRWFDILSIMCFYVANETKKGMKTMFVFGEEVLADELAIMAVSPREKEETALSAAMTLGTSHEPDANLLANVVVHGRRSVAGVAMEAIFREFGEQPERLEKILAELKRVITPKHQNFDLVRGL